jgi:hypothetical protein
MLVARVVSATVDATEDELEIDTEKAPFEEFPVPALDAVTTETSFAVSETLCDDLVWIVADGRAA